MQVAFSGGTHAPLILLIPLSYLQIFSSLRRLNLVAPPRLPMRLTFACSGPFPPDPEECEPPMLPPYRPTLLHRPFLTPLTGVVKQAVVDTPTQSMRRQTRRQHDETSFQEDETFVYHREIQSEYWSTAGDSWRHHPQYPLTGQPLGGEVLRFGW